MKIKKLEKIAEREMKDHRDRRFREPGWILYHGRRTGKIAVHLADAVGSEVDRDLLYIGGLFHDIGKGYERHHEVGARDTRKLLADEVCKPKLDIICEMIRNHNQRGADVKCSQYARLLQDADLLDHVGPVEIWLAYYWSGTFDEAFADHEAYFAGEQRRREREYMATHLNFKASRKMMARRVAEADRFLTEFQRIYREGI